MRSFRTATPRQKRVREPVGLAQRPSRQDGKRIGGCSSEVASEAIPSVAQWPSAIPQRAAGEAASIDRDGT